MPVTRKIFVSLFVLFSIAVISPHNKVKKEKKEAMSPLGNTSTEDCANYCVVIFSDMTPMVIIQNLFSDGGFSSTGMSLLMMEKFMK